MWTYCRQPWRREEVYYMLYIIIIRNYYHHDVNFQWIIPILSQPGISLLFSPLQYSTTYNSSARRCSANVVNNYFYGDLSRSLRALDFSVRLRCSILGSVRCLRVHVGMLMRVSYVVTMTFQCDNSSLHLNHRPFFSALFQLWPDEDSVFGESSLLAVVVGDVYVKVTVYAFLFQLWSELGTFPEFREVAELILHTSDSASRDMLDISGYSCILVGKNTFHLSFSRSAPALARFFSQSSVYDILVSYIHSLSIL